MPNNIQMYAEMADDTAAQITGSYKEWTAFLTTAARLYKYPYPEQLMIYAQRPEATACASYDIWNKRMGRYVRRGSKGIALIDMSSGSPSIKYVFDVADTGRTKRSRRVDLWQYKPEHAGAVSAMLERRYNADGQGGVEAQFERAASQLADEYWSEHREDILAIVDDSFLYGYDEDNVRVAFRNAAAVSITYSLMSRCGMEPEEYFSHEDFLSVFDWNTPAAVTELGTAVSSINQELLRQIEITVKQYEREAQAFNEPERKEQHGKQPDLHTGRGLPDSQPRTEPTAEAEPRQVRENAAEVPSGEQAEPVQPPAAQREAVPAPAGDRPSGGEPIGADDAGAGESGGRDGDAESQRPHEMGGVDEHLQGAGGGSNPLRADYELTSTPADEPTPQAVQLSFFPSEDEQIEYIQQAESISPSAFSMSIPQEDIDHVLRMDGNTDNARMMVVTEFAKGKTAEEIAAFLQNTFHGGSGIVTDNGRYAVWYAEDGIHIANGDAARYLSSAKVVSWTEAAERIGQLLEQGGYATNVELAEASEHERTQLANKLWYLRQDFSEEAIEQGFMSSMADLRGDGFPEETAALAAALAEPAGRDALTGEYREFLAAHAGNPKLLRFNYHGLEDLRTGLDELSLPRREFHTEMSALPESRRFISEDEIAATLSDGSTTEGSKERIYAYFQQPHTLKEQAGFLKNEYGTGGHSHAVSRASYSGENHGSKGIKLQKQDCPEVQLTWNQAAKRIADLIRKDRYLTPKEKEQFAQRQRQTMARANEYEAYNAIKEAHSDDLVLFQVGDFFELYGEDAKTAAAALGLNLTTRAIPNVGRVELCGVPAHTLERYVEALRGSCDVTISAVDEQTQERRIYSMRSNDHEEELGTDDSRTLEAVSAPISDAPDQHRAITQADIDDALRAWNGDMDSKRAVVRYMEAHARDKDTAAWLSREYGGDENKNLFISLAGSSESVELSWPKVQRRIAQLIQKDEFYTDAERDNFEDIDPIAIREYLESGESSRFVEQVMADVERIAAQDTSIEDAAPSAEIGRDPLAPAYHVGDTVYLDEKPFTITEVREFSVQLNDPSLRYPIARAESRENFERLLRQDERNSAIVNFLPADLDTVAVDLQELLAADGGLLAQNEKDAVSSWLSAGESNKTVADFLREMTAGRVGTIELETGKQTDYFASANGVRLEISDAEDTKAVSTAAVWIEIAEIVRAMYQQERDGFSREPVSRESETPILSDAPDSKESPVKEETVAFYPAEQNHLPYDIEIRTLHIDEPEQKQPPQNFRITDDNLGVGGSKAKFRMNMDAINLLKELELDGRQATPDEQEILSRYVGWGGLPDAFDESKENWKNEFAELYAALSPEEYAAARASTLNAHYTSPTVIRAIYDAVENMSFQTGNILEPSMGVGNFFGLLPDNMAGSKLYGVELDSLTGRIAKQLYPNADITVAGFETTDRRDFFDLAVGNVPFGDYKVNDRAYNKLGFSIHNYFFAKTIDQVRPGGVIAFVTSRYTLDAKDPTVRKYLAQRAELLGAIRLPNNAFKANAGTDVVSDIIFLQKKDSPSVDEPDWVHLGENEDGFAINSYFIDHPEMVLGQQTSESTQYGRQDFTVAPIEGADLADQLREAVQQIHGTYLEAELPGVGEAEAVSDSIPADPDVKNYSYTLVNGEIYFRENSIMVKPSLNATAKERVKGMIELRECVNRLIGQQMDGFVSDTVIRQTQAELNTLYDSFAAQYGRINDRGNKLAFANDSSYYLLCSLEVYDDDGNFERKADMFTKRTIKPHEVVTSVDTASEALALSISEKARVDFAYMSQLTGKNEAALISELRGVVFHDPVRDEWQTADEYLSGNVRQKLSDAEFRVERGFKDYLLNVEALKAAQPKDLDASEIEVRLGATWIDKKYIQQFMEELLETPYYLRGGIRVNFAAYTGEWNITGKSRISSSDVNAYMTYGTERASAYRILEDTLNLRDVRIYDTVQDPDGRERRVLNSKETTLAQQKQQAIKDAFRDWLWKDPERRRTLVTQYNKQFNSTRPREYDGSHITFGGINPEITLREHQLNAIAHVLYGGNTLLAHEVGAGKTFEMVAAAMESKRLGLCQKSLFAVPNHLTEQWASEFLRLYPSANILVATRKDFETHNRKKFCARIATGDYDAVIIGHSQFERIPVSRERQEQLLQEQIGEVEEGLQELKNSRAERFTIKQLERTKKSLEARLEKLMANDRKDDVVTFEQLGVDRLFVDEAHNYKNLFLYTKMRNVAGLSTSDAQKSSDMLLKCRYLDEITDSKGVIFATGTPVSNSMTELYTMQRYLQHNTIQQQGLAHFDSWASVFGETQTAIELAPEGTGYRARTRFSRFFNLPELMTLFKEVADIKTADQLNLPTPTPVYHNEVAKPTAIQQEMVQQLSERASVVHAGKVDASVDNMLKITSDGRKLGLDQRIINPDLPDDPNSKVNMCVNNIVRIWEEGQADKLTQLVFCDISTPKNAPSKKTAKAVDSPKLHALEQLTEDAAPEKPFSIYDDIREKLAAKGIPREQVVFIHEANTEVRKKELFAKVRSGQVRVLMGSTFKMGAGMNVQDRLIALHDLDCPWRPGDLEQRSGRIIRQGNRNEQVHIYRYVTEGTFDSYLWQTVENKQKFISQIMTSKSPVRSCEDIDETALSYAEIKALCAGDSRIKEKMDLDIDVSRLRLMKANHQSQQYRLEDDLLKRFPEQVEESKGFIAGFEADMATLAEHPCPEEGFVGMEVKGDLLTDKDNAGAALLEAFKDAKGMEPVPIGSYRGFSMSLTVENFGQDFVLTLKGQMRHRVTLGKDARGNLTRIENALAGIPNRLKTVQDRLDNLYKQIKNAKAELGKPFPQEEELRVKSARLAELNAELNIDDKSPIERLAEQPMPKQTGRPSVLAKLKQPLPEQRGTPKETKHQEMER